MASRLLLQKLGLQPTTYKLYPTAFRLDVPYGIRPLSIKASHAVAVLAIMDTDLDILDCQACTGEWEYFNNLPEEITRAVYRGTADNREYSSYITWSPYQPGYRQLDSLPAHYWWWLDALAAWVAANPAPATGWEEELVDVPAPPPGVGRRPEYQPQTSGGVFRDALDTHSLDLTEGDVAHLRQWYLPSVARILRWDSETTWPRIQAEPYYPGMATDWERQTILAVEPRWVRVWTPHVDTST
jgi:hypothetical protein